MEARIILFKAKRVDNGEWIEGFYFSCWNKHYILWGMTNNIPNMTEIDPKTLCQFTGLLDKNGNKIFEGDIMLGKSLRMQEPRKWKVVFENACFYVRLCEYHGRFEMLKYGVDFEIIGNIHDKE